MSSTNVLDGITKFCKDPAWTEPFRALILTHSAAACAEFGLDTDAVPVQLGPEVYAMFITCILEDFMTRADGPDGANVTDAYLKRHAWKLSSSAKRALQTIRASHMGLYEIVAINQGQGFDLRDLLRGGEIITVIQPTLSRGLMAGCMLGVRVVTGEDGATTVTAGLLPFDENKDKEAVAYVRAALGAGEEPLTEAQLAEVAPAISNFWLKKTLEETLKQEQAAAADVA
ncbi:MAG TPA: hypothetical protein VMB71_04185 [Acetobacteraceae bacterium]|nr:hypothetical protein [Acetobacteraceae bacterium]